MLGSIVMLIILSMIQYYHNKKFTIEKRWVVIMRLGIIKGSSRYSTSILVDALLKSAAQMNVTFNIYSMGLGISTSQVIL